MKESANEAISVHEEEESGEEISDLPNIDNLKTKKK